MPWQVFASNGAGQLRAVVTDGGTLAGICKERLPIEFATRQEASEYIWELEPPLPGARPVEVSISVADAQVSITEIFRWDDSLSPRMNLRNLGLLESNAMPPYQERALECVLGILPGELYGYADSRFDI